MKIALYLVLTLFFCTAFSAEKPVPHVFEAGKIIKAEEINANFEDLATRIETLSSTLPDGKLILYVTPTSYEISEIGGRIAANNACEAIDTNLHFCSVSQVVTGFNYSGVQVPTNFAGAWIDSVSGNDQGGPSCGGWVSINSTLYGGYISSKGGFFSDRCDYAASRPLLCCKKHTF